MAEKVAKDVRSFIDDMWKATQFTNCARDRYGWVCKLGLPHGMDIRLNDLVN